jgi:hypothetical protein
MIVGGRLVHQPAVLRRVAKLGSGQGRKINPVDPLLPDERHRKSVAQLSRLEKELEAAGDDPGRRSRDG